MALAKSKAKKGKGAVEAKKAAAETKKAAADAGKAVKDLSGALVEQARTTDLDERAEEILEKVKGSDAYGKALAKRGELTDLAKDKVGEYELDKRAEELAKRIREAETTKQARKRAQKFSDQGLASLGEWLADSPAAEKLGVQKRRRFPVWLSLLVGAVAGYLIGTLTAPKRGEELRADLGVGGRAREDLTTAAERLAQDTADVAAPPAQKPIADEVRTRLGEDPRTAGLPKLNVNVAEGTVFVRGSLPGGYDEQAIRDVVASVPGVTDVDLQLTTTTG